MDRLVRLDGEPFALALVYVLARGQRWVRFDPALLDRAGPHLSIKDRDLSAPPGSPANGDTYIPKTAATGAWAGHEDHIAYYTTEGTPGWVFYVPRKGYLAYIEDEQVISVFKTAWSAGVAI
jgi:hypothetical protein